MLEICGHYGKFLDLHFSVWLSSNCAEKVIKSIKMSCTHDLRVYLKIIEFCSSLTYMSMALNAFNFKSLVLVSYFYYFIWRLASEFDPETQGSVAQIPIETELSCGIKQSFEVFSSSTL